MPILLFAYRISLNSLTKSNHHRKTLPFAHLLYTKNIEPVHDKNARRNPKNHPKHFSYRATEGAKELPKWDGFSAACTATEFLRLFAKILNNVTQKNPDFGFFQKTNACVCLGTRIVFLAFATNSC